MIHARLLTVGCWLSPKMKSPSVHSSPASCIPYTHYFIPPIIKRWYSVILQYFPAGSMILEVIWRMSNSLAMRVLDRKTRPILLPQQLSWEIIKPECIDFKLCTSIHSSQTWNRINILAVKLCLQIWMRISGHLLFVTFTDLHGLDMDILNTFWAHLCICTVGSYASLGVCPSVDQNSD